MRLSSIAAQGTWLPLAFLGLATAWPWFGELAMQGIGVWACLIVGCGVLAMSPGRIDRADLGPTLYLAVGASLLAPALAFGCTLLLPVSPELRLVMLVLAAAPIAQAAGPLAAILGLPDRAATLAALTTVLLAPLILPAVVALFTVAGPGLSAEGLTRRVLVVALLPALVAFAARRFAAAPVAAWRLECRGIVILALSMVAAARGPGLHMLVDAPLDAAWMAGLACLVTLCGMAAAGFLTAPFGLRCCLAATYAGGTRNISVAWTALAPLLDADGMLFVTMMAFPFYLLPIVMRPWARRLLAASPPTPVGHAGPAFAALRGAAP